MTQDSIVTWVGIADTTTPIALVEHMPRHIRLRFTPHREPFDWTGVNAALVVALVAVIAWERWRQIREAE